MTQLAPAKRRSFDERFALVAALPTFIPETERYKLTLQDVGKGGVIRLGGKVWLVQELNTCTDKDDGYLTTELVLFCLTTGEKKNIEWSIDDELEVSESLRELSFSDLRDDEGEEIDIEDLEQIIQERDVILLNGQEFKFDEDCSVTYRAGNKPGETTDVWTLDFKAKGGKQGITIEVWPSDDCEVWLWQAVDPDSIEVLYTGGE